jgi:transposase InsO family protein
LCEIANISRSTYYRTINKEDKDKELKEKIKEIYFKYNGIYGYRRITIVLKREGKKVNHKKVYRLMKEMGIYAKIRRKNYIRRATKETQYVSDNKLKRNFKSKSKYEKFVSDITEIKTIEGKLYLMIIQDLYNNEIVSYGVSKSNNMELAHKVIDEWLQSGKYKEGSIFHTDRGFQFTHILTVKKLNKKRIIQSMSRKGLPQDNGPAESFFSHFKEELVKIHGEKTDEEYKKLIEEYIRFYNEERYQIRLNGMTPVEYRSHAI